MGTIKSRIKLSDLQKLVIHIMLSQCYVNARQTKHETVQVYAE